MKLSDSQKEVGGRSELISLNVNGIKGKWFRY